LLDALLLAGQPGTTAALNLGGISNITVVRGPGDLCAYDIGPANALIDAVISQNRANPRGFDEGGRVAASGTVDEELLAVLLDDPYYRMPAPKSTGKEHFHGGYVSAAVVRSGRAPTTADLVATLTELTVRTVAAEVRAAGVDLLVVSGGGCRNPVLFAGLVDALPGVRVVRSDEFGAPADDKEAIAFALIGWCTAHGIPGNEPTGTGARGARILGTITPGCRPLKLPAPLAEPLRSLCLSVSERRIRNVDFRPATMSDLERILAVFMGCWRESYAAVLPQRLVDAMTDEDARALWSRVLAEAPAGDVIVAETDEPSGRHDSRGSSHRRGNRRGRLSPIALCVACGSGRWGGVAASEHGVRRPRSAGRHDCPPVGVHRQPRIGGVLPASRLDPRRADPGAGGVRGTRDSYGQGTCPWPPSGGDDMNSSETQKLASGVHHFGVYPQLC